MDLVPQSQVLDLAEQSGAATFDETGFETNFSNAFKQYVNDDMAFVSKWYTEGPIRARDADIYNAIEEGQVPQDVLYTAEFANGKLDFNYLAGWLNRNRGTKIPDTDELFDIIQMDQQMRGDEVRKDQENADVWGKIGYLGGGFSAAMLNPIYYPTYFVGIGAAARAATVIGGAIRGAAITAGVEVAAETANQLYAYQWKNNLGILYSTDDAVDQILFAAGFGGVVGAGAGALTKALTKLSRRSRSAGRTTEADMLDAEASISRDKAPDQPDDKMHQQNIRAEETARAVDKTYETTPEATGAVDQQLDETVAARFEEDPNMRVDDVDEGIENMSAQEYVAEPITKAEEVQTIIQKCT